MSLMVWCGNVRAPTLYSRISRFATLPTSSQFTPTSGVDFEFFTLRTSVHTTDSGMKVLVQKKSFIMTNFEKPKWKQILFL